MSQLGTFTEFHDYLKALATSHIDILGFKFGEKEIVKCGARSNMTLPAMWAESYDPVTITDNKSDNHSGQLNSVLYVFDSKPKKWDDQRTKYSVLEEIAKDIVAKILKDYNEGLLQAELNGYRFGWSEMTLGSSEMLACRIDLKFTRPERLAYNAAKWE